MTSTSGKVKLFNLEEVFKVRSKVSCALESNSAVCLMTLEERMGDRLMRYSEPSILSAVSL